MKVKKEYYIFKKYFHPLALVRSIVFDKKKVLSFIMLLAGPLCFIIGSLALVGWYTETLILCEVFPGLTPIYYNTALCLVVIGIGLIALISGHKRVSATLGFFVTIIAIITVVEYLINVNFGIDELFFKTNLNVYTSSPGRMSPNSAISLLACAIALIGLSFNNLSRTSYFIILLLGMLVFALGTVSLLGYTAHLPITYLWAKLTPMALLTAIGLMIASGSIMVYVYGKHLSGEVNLSGGVPYLASIFVFCLTFLLWSASIQQEIESLQELISLEGDKIQEKIIKKIEKSVSDLEKLGLKAELFKSDKDWLTSAELYRKEIPWSKTIEWVDLNDHIRGALPRQGNENLLHRNISHDFLLQKNLNMIKKEGVVTTRKLIIFNPQSQDFYICIPIFNNNKLSGFIISIIDINLMLDGIAQESKISNFEFALFEGKDQNKNFFKTSNNNSPQIISQKEINLYNLYWTVKTWTTFEYFRSHTKILTRLIFLIGSFIIFLLFSVMRSRQTAKEQALRLQEMLLESNLHGQELQFLNDLTQALQACASLKMAKIPIAKYCKLLFPTTSGVVYLMDDKIENARPFCKWGLKSLEYVPFPVNQCMAFLKRSPCYVSGKGYNDPCEHLKESVSKNASFLNLCLPLTDQSGIIGLLHIRDYPYSENRKNPFLLPETLAIQLSLSISNIKKEAFLQEQTIRDPLTNLFNRRYLNEILPRELHRAQRQSQPLSIIMIDIDYFKQINDKYGHEAGDDVLKHISLLLQERFRKSDIPCRFGGEEFILVLPETSLNVAVQKSEQLRQAIIDLPLIFQGKTIKGLTISLGVASFPQYGQSANELIAAADQALYKAKKLGRNRVEVA
jgi:diguanylate cyclase (GGDEF)-like protein